MNFLGIGPGEIFLILILLLVVVGPERLPQFARTAGRFVLRVRDWVARSPDAQMVMRAREELEQELSELRKSLTEEVETVRKELESVRGDLAEATKMVEESAEEVAKTRIELDALADEAAGQANGVAAELADEARTIAPPDTSVAGDASAGASNFEVDPGPVGSRQQALDTQADAGTPANGQPVPRSFKPGQAPRPSLGSEQADMAEGDASVEALSRRLEALGEEFSRQMQTLSAEIAALRAGASPGEQAPRDSEASAALNVEDTLAEEAPLDAEVQRSGEAEPAGVAMAEAAIASEAAEVPAPEGLAEPVAVDASRWDGAGEARRRCKGLTRSGEPCGASPLKGQDYCRVHARQRVLEEVV